MASVRRVVVLTGGGDAPGMAAAIRAVVRAASGRGIETYGALGGIPPRGGTILGTARYPEFRLPEARREAIAHLERAGGRAPRLARPRRGRDLAGGRHRPVLQGHPAPLDLATTLAR